MPFYIRVTSLINLVHCITQTEEPDIKKYIINNYGDKKWQKITRYFADDQELKQ